jgi:hypothetical protein
MNYTAAMRLPVGTPQLLLVSLVDELTRNHVFGYPLFFLLVENVLEREADNSASPRNVENACSCLTFTFLVHLIASYVQKL